MEVRYQMDYQSYFQQAVDQTKKEDRYRIFRALERGEKFPQVQFCDAKQRQEITIWCGVDYLGLSQHPRLKTAMQEAIKKFGVGSGGTRNIGGNIHQHELLEQALARLHHQDAALLFTSGYMANEATLKTLGQLIPELIFFSDQQNHMSIIEGLRESRRDKIIFQHNDLIDLEKKLKNLPLNAPKIIVFESVYSMSGTIAPVKEIIALAKKYQALTYIDEVHALAVYGAYGGGLSEMTGTAKDIDIIQGTLSKGFGLIGGYIAGNATLIDAIRLYANGFIFTTSLPPQVAITALATLAMPDELQKLQRQLFDIVDYVKTGLTHLGLKVLPSSSQIIPLWIGDAVQCTDVGQRLLEEFKIYIQPVNYPTVRKGEERFRISPTALHTKEDADQLLQALRTCLSGR
jgi:5-aminolevulinate synthase